MAHMTWEPTYSLPAAVDLSSSQFCFGVINGSVLIALPTAGALPELVIDQAGVAGAMIRFFNMPVFISKVRVGTGGIAAGAKFCANASGHAVAGSSTHAYCGKALQAGVAGEYITARIDLTGALGAVT